MTQLLAEPPASDEITDYDRSCFRLYITLIDAEASRVDWHETYRQEFGVQSAQNVQAAYRQYLAHLKRAQWMATTGYTQLANI